MPMKRTMTMGIIMRGTAMMACNSPHFWQVRVDIQ